MTGARYLVIAAMAGLPLMFSSALAHHSYSMFDLDKSVTLEGTVTEVRWANPHIWIVVEVEDAQTGDKVEWSVEGTSPNMLRRRGWTRNAVNVGDVVEVVVNPVKAGGQPNVGSLSSISIDGKRIFTRQADPENEAGE